MGLDLRILPQYSQNSNLAHDIIGLDRDFELFDRISKLENEKGREVPRSGIQSFVGRDSKFEGLCYGTTINTQRNKLMKSVLVSELKEALADYKTENWKNRAFIAFLKELPDRLEMWLYWH